MSLEIGQSASKVKTITADDVYAFAEVVGDFNPLHVDAAEAQKSKFGRQIAHGMLVGSLFSALLGTVLPGRGTVYLEQRFEFLKPVFFNDTITATVIVDEIINAEKGIYRLKTSACNQAGESVIDGYAVVMFREG